MKSKEEIFDNDPLNILVDKNEQLETMEDNKIIAEFMGDVFYKNTGHWYNSEGCDIAWAEDDLQYHTSWNWLMPVVEKIEEIAIDDNESHNQRTRYQFDMGYTQCSIYDHIKDCVVASGDMGSKLLSTYQAVVEFINEYNKNT